MSKYIERESLIEQFDDSCKYAQATNDYQRGCNEVFDWCVKIIKNTPTADVVEVVRCRDCKWWKRMNGDKRLQCFHGHGLIRTTENDYCSRGERSEE